MTLKAVRPQEFDAAVVPFERELAGVFRGLEAAMRRELRKAMAEGLTPDQAVARVVAVLDQEVVNANAKAAQR